MFFKRLLLGVLNFLRFLKHREDDFLNYEFIPQMKAGDWDIYSNQLAHETGNDVSVYIRNTIPNNQLIIEKIIAPYEYEKVYESDVLSTIHQPITDYNAIKGCDWNTSLTLDTSIFKSSGYYRFWLSEGKGNPFTIIVSDYSTTTDVAILAPCTTWVAYNPWGGKSFYKNGIDKNNVYFVSTQRPNSALEYNTKGNIHDINVEANIFNWFTRHFKTTLYPDYILEKNPSQLLDHKLIVLAYHGEYFSEKMYKALRRLIQEKKKSFINLGGNQIYWKVKWHNNFTSLECRKNCAPFQDTYNFGGLWKNSPHPEKKLTGVVFSDEGTGTYAPYRVTDANHWLFEGSDVKNNDLFGIKGINEWGICGDETDKEYDAICIAKGVNTGTIGEGINYPDPQHTWDSKGGGALCVKEHSLSHATLATGSIQSGSGLGTDNVFTTVVKNFTERYIR